MTPQRRIILQAVRKRSDHPTASQVYDLVRRTAPRVSLGTVYRNLELLSASGLIQKVEGLGTQKRFDCRLERHHHIRCTQCGRVDDVSVELGNVVENTLQNSTEFSITGYQVDLAGICPCCKQQK